MESFSVSLTLDLTAAQLVSQYCLLALELIPHYCLLVLELVPLYCLLVNLRYEDDIDGLTGTKEELTQLVKHVGNASKRYGVEINTETSKLTRNNYVLVTTNILVHGQIGHTLEIINQFK